ncbi:hypothetical protein OG389_02415 [Streptomyces sp. NBC_00435]|uniref:hypothetical protein n=1 Tax=Streptomyces sp. NBC_00435 TaxID=2903649 RepID=UPI002E203768
MTPAHNAADSGTTAPRPPATAWALENTVFSAAMAAHRLPWTDAPARALGLDALTREGVTRALLEHLRRTRSGRPVRVSTPFGTFLVPLTPAVSESLLVRADEAGVLEPATGLTAGGHRYGLPPHTAVPPEALVPDGGLPALVAEEADAAIAARRGDGTVERGAWCEVMGRLSRRLVAGEPAAGDTLLSEIVTRARSAKGRGAREELAAALHRRTTALYLEGSDPASLVGRLVAAGTDVDTVVAAVAHVLDLVSEASSTTALQALALRSVEPALTPEEAVARALSHYPPVAAAVHRVRAPFVWEDLAIGAGTEILCAPGWLSPARDGARPGAWPSALCGAPSGCAATGFGALVAEELVRAVTAAARPFVLSPRLTAGRLPATLDARTLLVALEPSGGPGDGRVTVGGPAAVPVRVRGCAPASYGALARASAERLEGHAESLAACAGAAGWAEDGTAEKFRMVLLDHSRRCADAADGVRRAADRLAD